MNVYPFIEAEQAGEHNVKRACELLEVSRSAYYQQQRGVQSQRQRVDAQLTAKITQVHAVSKGTYGAPRIHADLADAGLRHGRKRVARLMRCAGLAGKSPRRWRTTTVPDPNAGRRPDLVNRDFGTDPAGIDTRWCGDITYINTWQGWLYLATVIDLASRRVVGWAVAEHLRTDLIDAALTDALVRRRPPSGLVFHSDRGCPIHQRPTRPPRRCPRHPPLCRPAWAVLGQRGRRVVLRHHQNRTATPPTLAHP
ncbi:IS3 family transposase [Micromonospora cremea]|uniref:Integrase core domain-containing protein n=1 Tax=Micromonospora cremea TaxID=709881 RepID=A0A1N5ZKT2_9ACTN|nr:IS3 family transposase [Micromonospora cremea]SIN22399.1 Integrase core domain-containing protein [Micromonospora cremea]